VLLEARGDLDRARSGIARAAMDWRDTLVSAGMEHADWPEVLQRAGYPVP
jgi:hypothetical protein